MNQPPQPPRWQPPQQPITWGTSQPGPQQPQQPPQWGPTPPPPRRQKPKNKAGKILGIIAACIVGFFVVALAIGAAVEEDKPADNKPAAKQPAYTVVEQDDEGNKRLVVVEVDTTKDLRTVFNAVTDSLDDEAGYFVQINCSTGGTDKVDNRLANGRYAAGHMGSVVTGLDEGATDFETNEGRSCPAK
ncbi:hypothetical protein [Streptomyces pactum]|uniref:Uncharacterized protein n=1 Tax=Streptomyces pactum TaxID=68249 RepID=A0A1S6JGI0_9ACTN|nr:hypothetical protein [Streptomyces pactum]AQS70854.1 hypothetical protein B1H29_31735 [Streptomyces pactum]